MTPKPLIVVPTYVTRGEDVAVVEVLLQSIRDTEPDADVLLVDDGSPDPTYLDSLRRVVDPFGWELALKGENTGFAKTVNVGLRRALNEGRDAILVNADMKFLDRDWIARLQAQTREDGSLPADVVGGLLLYPTGLIQHAGIFFSLMHRCFDHRYRYAPGDLPEAQRALRCPVTGALQLIRHTTLRDVGLYDEEFFLGWEDVDYCLRVFQSGGECVYQPAVRATHYESMFRGRPSPKIQDWQARSWTYFLSKYSRTSFAEWLPPL